jgi:hypothetical protein
MYMPQLVYCKPMICVSIIISWSICLLHLVYFYVSKFEAFHLFLGFFLMNAVDIFNKCLIAFFS